MSNRIQFRRDTAARWTSINPILQEGELGIETDTRFTKVGDGVHAFNDLEMLGYECLQELGDSTQFPVSQKVVSDNISNLSSNSNFELEDLIPTKNFLIGNFKKGNYIVKLRNIPDGVCSTILKVNDIETIAIVNSFTERELHLEEDSILKLYIGSTNTCSKIELSIFKINSAITSLEKKVNQIDNNQKTNNELLSILYNEKFTKSSTVATTSGSNYYNDLEIPLPKNTKIKIKVSCIEDDVFVKNPSKVVLYLNRRLENQIILSESFNLNSELIVVLPQDIKSISIDRTSAAKKDVDITLEISEIIPSLINQIDNNQKTLSYKIKDFIFHEGLFFKDNNGIISTEDNTNSKYLIIDTSEFSHNYIQIEFESNSSNSGRLLCTTDIQGRIIDKCLENNIKENKVILKRGSKLYISIAKNSVLSNISLILEINETKKFFVSANGNDNDNDGSQNRPFLTLDKALESGAEIIIVSGGVYEQNLNIDKAKNKNLTIIADKGERVIFKSPKRKKIENNSLLSGYTKVYKSENVTLPNKWIFQENSFDKTTLILDAERLPQQRGKEYRCENLLIKKIESNDIDSALETIENSNDYCYYYDSDNFVLYFSYDDNVESDIIAPETDIFIQGTNSNIKLTLIGIEVWYMPINVSNLRNAFCQDCAAKYAFAAGGFIWDKTIGLILIRCESARIFLNGSTGDGFNAHSSSYESSYDAKNTTATLIDCWSHDNNDDGYSDHERCEITIIGGLFEYNKKAGITPSYGSHCSCHNVISRKNIHGFLYTGTVEPEEGGKYGQLCCFNCLSENNDTAGYRVNGENNLVKLVNCISINNKTGYLNSNDSNILELINCKSKDDVTIKSGNITINNANLVE